MYCTACSGCLKFGPVYLKWTVVYNAIQDILQGVWNTREKELTRPALQYDYTCFAGYSIWKRVYYRSSFNFLNVFFYYAILNNTDFLYYKKYVYVLLIFSHPKKCICLTLFSLIFSLFIIVYNNLFYIHVRGICTSDKYFLFKWSTCGRAGAGSIPSPLYSILLGSLALQVLQ